MAKTKKTTVKEGLAEDTAKVKALKRKTRKVLKDPTKAGEVADELAKGGVDAPESAKDEDRKDDVDKPDGDKPAVSDVPADDHSVDGDVASADTAGDEADGLEAGDEHPDLCTFLEQAIANSKEAIGKYQETLAELKEKVKDMGLEVPGLLDPEDVADEQTPEEFPPDIPADDGDNGGDADGGDANSDLLPADGDAEGGDEGGDLPPPDDGGDGSGAAEKTEPVPTKDVESSIAAPAPTSGTKLK